MSQEMCTVAVQTKDCVKLNTRASLLIVSDVRGVYISSIKNNILLEHLVKVVSIGDRRTGAQFKYYFLLLYKHFVKLSEIDSLT